MLVNPELLDQTINYGALSYSALARRMATGGVLMFSNERTRLLASKSCAVTQKTPAGGCISGIIWRRIRNGIGSAGKIKREYHGSIISSS